MGVKLKTDENLPESAAALLREAGHDVTTALAQGLGGVADPRVASVCRGEARALVTLDRGLGDIRAYPPVEYHGIIVLRPADQRITTIQALIRRLVPLLEAQSTAGALWIVDERRVRIRRYARRVSRGHFAIVGGVDRVGHAHLLRDIRCR